MATSDTHSSEDDYNIHMNTTCLCNLLFELDLSGESVPTSLLGPVLDQVQNTIASVAHHITEVRNQRIAVNREIIGYLERADLGRPANPLTPTSPRRISPRLLQSLTPSPTSSHPSPLRKQSKAGLVGKDAGLEHDTPEVGQLQYQVEQLSQDNSELEERYTQLKLREQNNEFAFKEFQRQVGLAEQKQLKYQREIKRLEDQRFNDKRELEQVQRQVLELKDETSELNEQNSRLKRENSKLREEYSELEGENSQLKEKIIKVDLRSESLLQELLDFKGTVLAYVRVRTESPKREKPNGGFAILADEKKVVWQDPDKDDVQISFDFDGIFASGDTNTKVFEQLQQYLPRPTARRNTVFLASGLSGSGKSYTMLSQDDSLVVLSLKHLLHTSNSAAGVQCQCVEVYANEWHDVLDQSHPKADSKPAKKPQRGKEWTEPTRKLITSDSDIDKLVRRMRDNRHVRTTKANAVSSRGHLVIRLQIPRSEQQSSFSSSSANLAYLVDLAGNERLDIDAAPATKETISINTDNAALCAMIESLNEKGTARQTTFNSLLCQYLQDALQPNTKFVEIATLSLADDARRTKVTLKFAQKLRETSLNLNLNLNNAHSSSFSGTSNNNNRRKLERPSTGMSNPPSSRENSRMGTSRGGSPA